MHKLQDQVRILLDSLSLTTTITITTTTSTTITLSVRNSHDNIVNDKDNAQANAVAIYRNLKLHLLQGVQKELKELHRLLTTPLREL